MKRSGWKAGLASAFAVMLCNAGAAVAEVADQESACSGGSLNIQAASPLGQTFQPSQDTLLAVDLMLAAASDSIFSSDVTVTVREDDFAGAVVGSKTRNVSPLNFDGTVFRFEFDSPLTVVPDTTYLLEISASNFAVAIHYGVCGYDRGRGFASFGISDDMDFRFSTFGPCGNGALDPGEDCDSGVANPCCALPTCQYASSDTACSFDANECTDDHCDGAGACTADNSAEGADCTQDTDPCMIESCDGAGACVSAEDAPEGTACSFDSDLCTVDQCDGTGDCIAVTEPVQDCSLAEKASLKITDSDKPGKDKVKFQWKKGPVFLPHIGSPTIDTDYALCVYDGSSLRASALLPPNTEWQSDLSKIWYEDKDGDVAAITGIAIKFDDEFVTANASMSLGGDNLSLDIGTLPAPVVAQIRTEAGGCWGASFASDEIKKNDGKKLVATEKNALP